MTLPLSDPPIRTSLLLALTTQSTLLTEFFTSLPTNPAEIPGLHSSLIDSSARLDALSRDAEEHQRRWAVLMEKKRQVEALEMQVRALVRVLENGKTELEAMVDEGRRVLDSIDKSEKEPVSVPVLLAHAHALARTTSAPVSSLLAPADRAQSQPWPSEANMRQGLLFQLEGSMSGVGDVGVVGDERKLEDVIEERTQVIPEESGRAYDPNAMFQLDLNSDESDDD